MPKITAIGTATPTYRHRQQDIMQFMLDANNPDEKNRKLIPILYRRSGIETRYSVFPDFSLARGQWGFFGNNCSVPSLEKRMTLYNEQAVDLSVKAINDCFENNTQTIDIQSITHLITVTCTGISAPGLDILLMKKFNLSSNIVRTSVNFMGCYAAIHALKIADAFCRADAAAKVLVVCTELCTLHFQKTNDVDAILSSTLFADGSAACLVSGENDAKGLEIKQFYSKVALGGQDDMAWHLSSTGFLMTLSNHVPKLVKDEIKHLLDSSLAQISLTPDEITDWAIHPGGKNILEAVENSLNKTKNDLSSSYNILKNYGNMSSPTILFVIKAIMEDVFLAENNETKQRNIFAVAFGPGITMESMILSK